MPEILIIDNYDSFVYNIAQYVGELGATAKVVRNDSPRLEALLGNADGYIVSPGPGHPRDAGKSLDVISNEGYGRPVLGVCLGHQAIAHVHGGEVVRAASVVHGKVTRISHTADAIFDGVPGQFQATRYHSLVVRREGLPASLGVLAESDAGEIMALRVGGSETYGLQFHPESVMTACGKTILSNFLGMCGR